MGWKLDVERLVEVTGKGRNPLSLDMGWKSFRPQPSLKRSSRVAIRFRWIWVGNMTGDSGFGRLKSRNPLSLDMGWKFINVVFPKPAKPVAIRFRWIWVGKLDGL